MSTVPTLWGFPLVRYVAEMSQEQLVECFGAMLEMDREEMQPSVELRGEARSRCYKLLADLRREFIRDDRHDAPGRIIEVLRSSEWQPNVPRENEKEQLACWSCGVRKARHGEKQEPHAGFCAWKRAMDAAEAL